MGISVGIRSMISRVLEVEGNSKAKLYSKLYYVYTSFLSIILILIIFWKGNEIGGIFTQNLKIKESLNVCFKIYIINCIPELLYLATATLLKLNKQSEFAFKMFTLVFPIYTSISAFLYCFGFKMGVYGLILSFSTGKAIVIIFAIKKLFSE
jgi:Na+-driven multidrug efflux pump